MAIAAWVDVYRPKTINDYVWKDEFLKNKITDYIKKESIPHLLMAGKCGTGKTSIIYVILNELKIPKGDILWIPASRESNIEIVRNKIGNFVNTWALGPSGIKYVVLDELDSVSQAAQKMLRTDMERFSNVRFLATCNYLDRIEPAIRSRFTEFVFKSIDLTEFTIKMAEVLNIENIQYDLDTLDTFVKGSYPDMRKCINLLQQNSLNGALTTKGLSNNEENHDYMLNIVDLFKQRKYLEARKLLITQAQPEQYPEIYKFLYNNVDLFGDTIQKQEDAILEIRKGLVSHSQIADIEINLAATLVALSRIAKL